MNVHHLNLPQFDRGPEPVVQAPQPTVFRDLPEPDFDLRAFFRILLARRWTVVSTIAVCMTVAGLALLQMAPLYSASALIMIGQRENRALDQEALLAGLNTDTATIENQIQILRSSTLAERVIKKLNLGRDREFDPARARWSLSTLINPSTWFESPPPRRRAGAVPAIEGMDPALLRLFASRLTVAAQGRSSVIRVTFDSTSRDKAARIANTIAEQYLVGQLETKFDASKRATQWMDDRLSQLAEQVRKSENAVEQYRIDNGLSDGKNGNSLAGEQLSELNGQIVLARSNLAEQEAKFRQVKSLYHSGGSADSIAAVINSPLISTLRGQQAELIRKEAELGTKYGDKHPQMIALRDEKRNLDLKIEEEVKRIMRNLGNEVAVAKARLKSLEMSQDEIKGTANSQSQASVKLRELEREAQANRTLFENMQARLKANEDKDQVQTADAQLTAKASVPQDPSFPNKPLVMGVTLIGSAIMGMLLALMLERLDNGVRVGPEIERLAQVSNLSVVPKLPGVKHVADRIVNKPLSAFSEAVRSLHAALLLSNVDRPPKVVVMTSSVPNEGKTSLAVALGRLASRGGARVLLIDADLRHPSVGGQFSPRAPEGGLVEVLSGKRDLASVLHRDPISPLEFLPVATAPSNPADLLSSAAMKKLVEVLRQYYDLIILDAAPVLPVSDTRLLARLADKVVYVVKWDATPREAVANGIRLLREANADVAGTVLNQADLRRHAIYGYGYSSYGYGANYGRYYAE